MKTFKELANVTESKVSDELAKQLDKIIDKIDDSMDIKDFAQGVAKILKNNYGTHNYNDFMKVLKDNL